MNQNFFLEDKAVSASPNFVTHFLNKSGDLERKTSLVVVYLDIDLFDIYRSSTSAPGMWSREIYRISNRKMLEKDNKKYLTPPLVPDDAFEYVLGNITASSAAFLTYYDLQYLRVKLDL